ncbi:hypothetical protein [Spirosoma luteolum]
MSSSSCLAVLLTGSVLMACQPKPSTETAATPLQGTWKLISGTLIEKGDTTVTSYTGPTEFIKIINGTHFAFLLHDRNKGKDSSALFSAGGGTYTLQDSTYTEHLDYSSDRAWEGHTFPFTLTIRQDTLTQRGVEKVASAGIDRLNIEQYVRVK